MALGGWTFCNSYPDCTVFPRLAASPTARATFVKNAIKFCRDNGFDGIDFDWEYPGQGCEGSVADYDNVVSLLSDTMKGFESEASSTGNERLLVTIALPPPIAHPKMKFGEMSKHIDWINLMTYDMAGTWTGYTWSHTALTSPTPEDRINIDTIIKEFVLLGVPTSKIVLGTAFYGHSWTLQTTQTTPKSPTWIGGKVTRCLGDVRTY